MDEREKFLRRFGGVYERSPWVAERCFDAAATIDDVDELAAVFARCVDDADRDTKPSVHPSHRRLRRAQSARCV